MAALFVAGLPLSVDGRVGAQGPPAEPPATPTGLTGTFTHESVSLSWDDPGDPSITGYQILRRERGVHEVGDFQIHVDDTNSAATSYVDTAVEAEASYVYRVKARNSSGRSERSRFFRADLPAAPDPPAPGLPDPPTNLMAEAAGETQIDLSWTAPEDTNGSDVVGYRIEVSTDAGTSWTDLIADTGSTITTYTHTGLESGATRHYRTSAINSVGTGAPSNVASATTDDLTPPGFVAAVVGADGDSLELYFNEPLDLDPGRTPRASSFGLTADGAAIAVGAVQVIPGRAQSVSLIGLSPAIREGQTASVSYTDPTSGNDEAAIQDRAGNDAASLADQPVTNGSTLTGASTRGAPAQDVVTQPATATATAQIGAILAAKAQRTPTQRKVSSRLLDAMGSPQLPEGQEGGGEEPQPPAGSGPQRPAATDGVGEFELVTVDIRADVTPEVLGRIRALGGTVINSVPKYRAIRAQLPLVAVQPLAALSAVQSIRPADEAVTHKNTSEGDAAHLVNTVRTTHGVTGSGIGIGVISDGVATLAAQQASGDLPAQVAVLPGQEGSGDEGTAMLEIVHDLAPGAELYFATGFTGQAQFAANIEALCEAGADVIVDDLSYYLELSFQDSIIAQGVNAATANGCYFFSSAGNNGNLNDETSGVWEGDYVAGTPMIVRGSTVGVRHDFGGGKEENAVRGAFSGRAVLQWADPLGASANDYDLFLVDGDGTVLLSSTDTQDGTQDPIETFSLRFFAFEDVRLVIVQVSGEARYLRLQLFHAKLEIATAGATYGHSASENTVGVGQVDVRTAGGAGGIFDGTESVMAGSSDGPRRLFYEPDGTPITPDDFSSTGGKVLKKPDLSAASCVSTATPGFSTFCGTSAAAPHAAAIAALMLAAAGGPAHVTPADLRAAMTATTAVLDIEKAGFDNNSGAGIVMAPGAIAGVAVAVADRNGAPTAASALTDRTLVAGLGAVTIDLASIFTDPDSDALTYSVVSSDPDRLGVTLSGTVVTLTPGAPGWSAVWARVTDPGGLGALQTFTVTVTAGTTDYDTDNDRLIEVSTLAQLDAMRYDLNGNGLVDGATWEPYYAAFSMGALEMGCPDGCVGYELAANLDFDTDGSGTTSVAGDTYWNDGAGWEPIGSEDNPYIANFWGDSHILANLFINRPTEDGIGLFGELHYAGTTGHIRDVGLVEVDVTGRDRVGALFGRSIYMTVFKSYATGRVTGRGDKVGGLAGESWGNLIDTYAAVEVSGLNLDQPPPSPPITCPPPCALVSGEARGTGGLVGLNLGVINSSYATGDVTGYPAGGLVGWNSGGSISASYATGAVTGTTVGGLVGRNDGPGGIQRSYATGRVSGNRDVGGLIGTNASIITANYSTGPVSATSSTDSSVGGLVGANESAFSKINESYWDSTTSGIAGARGLSTAALQGPTVLNGIYQTWSGRWDLGTSAQYPVLSEDFDGDGNETWQEFGHQLRAGPELTATGGIEQVVLDWPPVDAGHWTPAPGITYTLYRDATVVAENLSTLSYQDSGLTAGTYTYQVAAVVDGGEATRSAPVTATVIEIIPNNQPEFPSRETGARSVDENTAASRNIGTAIAAADADNDALTYSISGADAALFDVVESSGQLQTSGALDHESRDTYSFTMSVHDGKDTNGHVDTRVDDAITVTVTVDDVDEAPDISFVATGGVTVNDNALSVDENYDDTLATFTAEDPERKPGLTYEWSVVGTDRLDFTVTDDGVLSFAAIPDHEDPADSGGNNVYDITVKALDSDGHIGELRVTVTVVDVDEAPDVMGPEALTKAENSGTFVGSYTATDPEGEDVTWTTLTGADARHFAFDNGALSFVSEPDFEARPDNTYEVTVRARDESGETGELRVTVTVRDVDEAPKVMGPEAVTKAENSGTFVGRYTATDPEGEAVTWTTLTGADAGHFAFDNGALSFVSEPDFEARPDNTYEVTVRARDEGGKTGELRVTVTVRDVNEVPEFPSTEDGMRNVPENTPARRTFGDPVAAVAGDNDTLTYSITSGANLFGINTATGQLLTKAPLDREVAISHTIRVGVSDGKDANGHVDTTVDDTITVTVTVVDVDEAPDVMGREAVTKAENSGTFVGRYTATDPEGEDVTWTTLTGADARHFAFDNGALSFVSEPDFEARPDNTYEVTVRARDESGETGELRVTVTVRDVNEVPEFPSTEDGMRSVPENTPVGRTFGDPVAAVAGDNDTLTYSITSGADLFGINTATGHLFTKALLDREVAISHTIRVGVSDGKDANGHVDTTVDDTIEVAITVVDVDEAPDISFAATSGVTVNDNALTVDENYDDTLATFTASDPERKPGLTYEWSVVGTDRLDFTVTDDGVLSFAAIPDYEDPADSGGNNVYNITVRARDSDGEIGVLPVTVTVTPVNEAPKVMGPEAVTKAENSGRSVGRYTATDPEGEDVTWTTLTGADARHFAFDNGALSFVSEPDFEARQDNTYEVTVRARDEGGHIGELRVTVTVRDVNEVPEFPSTEDGMRSVPENTPAGRTFGDPVAAVAGDNDTLTYSITRGANLFGINTATGQLLTKAPLDRETAPSHTIRVGVSDGKDTRNMAEDPPVVDNRISVTITVDDVDEAPKVVGPEAVTKAENSGTFVGSYTATDPEGEAVTWTTLTGADAGHFAFDNGALSFVSEPDFEARPDNTYEVTVRARDEGGKTGELRVTVTVRDVNEVPEFPSTEDGMRSVPENTPAGRTFGDPVAAVAGDNDTLTYSITSGANLFGINTGTGQLLTKAALNRETAPSHTIRVGVSDGKDTRNMAEDPPVVDNRISVTITVDDVDEAPKVVGPEAVTKAENSGTFVGSYTATDPENKAVTWTTLTGADARHFAFDNGTLSFVSEPDFEARPDNTYEVTVRARDDSGHIGELRVTVTVLPVNERPTITGDAAPSIEEEGTRFVGTYRATDPESATIAWQPLAGSDSDKFEFNTSNGRLTFEAAPDFEDTERGGDNEYRVTLGISAGGHTITFDVAVTVTNKEEGGALGFSSPQPQAGADYTATLSDLDGVQSTTWTWERSTSRNGPWGPVSGAILDSIETSAYTPDTDDVGYFLRVTAAYTDGHGPNKSRVLVSANTVKAAPVTNDRPSFDEPTPTRSIAENARARAAVGRPVTATDPNSGDVLTYELSGSDLFTIDSNGGQIRVAADESLDHETAPSHRMTVTASDSSTASDTVTVTITVDDVNEPPTAEGDSADTPEDTEVTIDVVDNDSDPEDERSALTLLVATPPRWGSLVVNASANPGDRPTITYTPRKDYNGADSFEYRLRDTGGLTDTALVAIDVIAVNDAPTFASAPPTRSVSESAEAGANVGAPVTAMDVDENDRLTYRLFGSDLFTIDSNGGQIRVAADESLDHETAPSHRVTVKASDSSTESDTVTVTITVDDVNEPPTAEGDSADTREDSEVTIDILDNDSDPEDDRSELLLTVFNSGPNAPDHGTVKVNEPANAGESRTITYEPNADYNGSDTFIYQVRDTGSPSLSSTASVSIQIDAVNDAPVFPPSETGARSVSESAEAGDNVGAPVTATDVDANDTLTYSLFGANASSFEIDSNGQITVATGVTFDIATQETYIVMVDADDGNERATVEVTITVTTGPVGPPIITGGGGGGFAGGGGGGGGGGPSPSEVDFEWNVTRDIDELDGGQDKPSGQWSDGATLWILENGDGAGDAVYAYDLATGERVEEREFELDEANRAPRGVSSDRTTLWISDSGQEKLFAHDLETGERLPERDIALAARNRAARGIWTDGETMWVLDGGKDALFAYDLESGELLAEYALDSANDDPHGLFFDGVTFWVSDHGEKRLFAYRLKAGEDGEDELERNRDEEFPSTVLSRASNNSPRGIWSDGEVMYVADESDDKVYSYNMPDAIDARLASLTLSGVDIGEFSPGQTDYEGVAADGVTETTVEAEATQRRATVIVSPSDADGDPENGHQVAVEAGSEITVTVSSADGNRTRVYRVRLGGPEHEAPSDPTSHCFRGDVVEGFSLLIYEGGSLENFVVCAASRYVVALYVLDHGVYVPYIVGAPDFVNGSFHELYPDGVLPLTPLVAGSDGPPSGGHVVEGLAQDEPATLRGSNCLYGEIATGFSLAIFEGGSVEELEACGRGFGIAAFYALHEGDWVPFVLGATDLVNRPFFGLYDDGLPALTPLVARRDSPPAANADSGDAAEN